MLRDRNLVPFSHQHQHALALCVRLQRGLGQDAGAAALARWQGEVERQFQQEIRFHFEAEETILFPAASAFDELKLLVQELMVEHSVLRMYMQKAAERKLGREGLQGFAEVLSGHVHKEEQQLFEGCQRLLREERLVEIGAAVAQYFRAQGVPAAAADEIRT